MRTGYLIGNWSRFYVVDDAYRSLAKVELTGSTKECAEKIQKIKRGIPPSEVVELVKKALNSVDTIAVEDAALAGHLQETVGEKVIVQKNDIFRTLRLMFFRKGIYKAHDTALFIAREDKREADKELNMVITRMVDMLKTFDESYQFYENFVRTWKQDQFSDEGEETNTLSERSIVENVEKLLSVFSTLQKKTRKALSHVSNEVAPNLCRVAGPETAARLIAEAGSLKRLSTLSAGTIQILGAKKAFFRARHWGANPPKYGIIFSHPLVQDLPEEKRGKMARSLSCKIAIACRADQYTKRDISSGLLRDLEERFNELRRNP